MKIVKLLPLILFTFVISIASYGQSPLHCRELPGKKIEKDRRFAPLVIEIIQATEKEGLIAIGYWSYKENIFIKLKEIPTQVMEENMGGEVFKLKQVHTFQGFDGKELSMTLLLDEPKKSAVAQLSWTGTEVLECFSR